MGKLRISALKAAHGMDGMDHEAMGSMMGSSEGIGMKVHAPAMKGARAKGFKSAHMKMKKG